VTSSSPAPKKQPAWWHRSCGGAELLACGFCRRRHSERFFGGYREQVFSRA